MLTMLAGVVAGASVLFAAGTAFADGDPKSFRPITPGCAQFGGFYVGGQGGWAYYQNDWTDADNYGFGVIGLDHTGDASNSNNSWHAGVQGGFNWQRNCTVFGVMADWSWSNAEAESFYTDFPTPAQQTLSARSELGWFGTARLRTGLVVDNILLYVSGGFAWAKFDRDFNYSTGGGAPAFQQFSSDSTRWGGAAGAGTEWAIDENWSLNSEFLYLTFENEDKSFPCSAVATCGGAAVGTPFRFEFSDSVWVARTGVNYRF